MRWALWSALACAVLGLGASSVLAAEEGWKPTGDGWVKLFNGTDLTGWKFRREPNPSWKVVEGVMTNEVEKGKHGVDILTEQKFTNFELHIEFRVPKGGNSGVYLRGRQEIQVMDSMGHEPPSKTDCGSIYNKYAPAVNACKPAGEWQSFDAKVVGDKATVSQNGKVIQDNVQFQGVTGGALDGDDSKPGPLLLQGDHTAIEYRNIWIKPLPDGPTEEKK